MRGARMVVLVLVVLTALIGGGAYYIESNQNEIQPQSEAITQDGQYRLAAYGGCHGAECNGRNPSGLCDDGTTVASKNVKDGVLELRYSPSCKSNWGRYTPYWDTAWGYYASGIQIHARVTAWNPNGPSYGAAHHNDSIFPYGSSWSQMVDGTKKACTGVEIVHYHADWHQSQGWHWRSCY